MMLDMDLVKATNKRHGQPAGDPALEPGAARTHADLRGVGPAGRLRGGKLRLVACGRHGVGRNLVSAPPAGASGVARGDALEAA